MHCSCVVRAGCDAPIDLAAHFARVAALLRLRPGGAADPHLGCPLTLLPVAGQTLRETERFAAQLAQIRLQPEVLVDVRFEIPPRPVRLVAQVALVFPPRVGHVLDLDVGPQICPARADLPADVAGVPRGGGFGCVRSLCRSVAFIRVRRGRNEVGGGRGNLHYGLSDAGNARRRLDSSPTQGHVASEAPLVVERPAAQIARARLEPEVLVDVRLAVAPQSV